MARSRKKAGLPDIRHFGLLPGEFQRLRRMLALGDVRKGDHHSARSAVLGAIGQYPSSEPRVASGFDLPLDRHKAVQYRLRIGRERTIGRKRIKVRERPTDIAWNDVEQRSGSRREEADP